VVSLDQLYIGFYRFQHVFQVSVDGLILEPDHSDILLPKILRPLRIVLRTVFSEMAGTVKFDNQPAFQTIKVDNVRTYALLPAKLLTLS